MQSSRHFNIYYKICHYFQTDKKAKKYVMCIISAEWISCITARLINRKTINHNLFF